jgi:hypothetical protein
VIKTHRSADSLATPARSRSALDDHPLWTMSLHTDDPSSQASSEFERTSDMVILAVVIKCKHCLYVIC